LHEKITSDERRAKFGIEVMDRSLLLRKWGQVEDQRKKSFGTPKKEGGGVEMETGKGFLRGHLQAMALAGGRGDVKGNRLS